jgi:hypothetical protein
MPVLSADASHNPYAAIAERNVFNLRPPPSATPPEPPPPPVPKITLTGITTILGDKRALFKVQEQGTPPARAAKEESYILAEGQRDGDVEVLAIDEAAGAVKVNNHGTVQELTLDKDGAKLPKIPLAAGISPAPAASAQNPAAPAPPGKAIPPRMLLLPPAPNSPPAR